MKVNISDVCTVKEFADLMKVHPNTIKKAIKLGKIHAFRVTEGEKSPWRILKTETQRMAEEEYINRKK